MCSWEGEFEDEGKGREKNGVSSLRKWKIAKRGVRAQSDSTLYLICWDLFLIHQLGSMYLASNLLRPT